MVSGSPTLPTTRMLAQEYVCATCSLMPWSAWTDLTSRFETVHVGVVEVCVTITRKFELYHNNVSFCRRWWTLDVKISR